MNTLLQTPITTFGLDKAMMNTLEFLVSDEQKNKFVITTSQDELICISHLKTSADVASLKKYRQKFPERPVIVISKNTAKGKNIISIRPPVTPRRLLDALTLAADQLATDPAQPQAEENRAKLKMSAGEFTSVKNKPEIISESTEKRLAMSQADIDLNDSRAVDVIRYSDERFLQGRLISAFAKGQAGNTNIQIYTPHGVFHYYPGEHQAHVEVSDQSLRNLASVPDSITSIMTEFDKEELEDIENKRLVCADELLWKVTVWASRGRIPIQTDLDQPFTVKHWPNFTRLMITPYAMQITALWLGSPLTLRETIAILGIPQRYVFTFYCAVLAIDLVEFDVPAPSSSFDRAEKKSPSKFKGFIGKLLDYVKPGEGEEI